MPTLPNVPGVARVSITYSDGVATFGSRIFLNTQTPGASASEMTELATSVQIAFADSLLEYLADPFALVNVTARDLTSETGAEGGWDGTDQGTGGAAALPSNVSMDLTLSINSHYRGGHPVFHMPPGPYEALENPRAWNIGQVGAVTEAGENFLTDLNALEVVPPNQCQWVVLRNYRSGVLPEAVSMFPVQRVNLRQPVGTMRRRARALR